MIPGIHYPSGERLAQHLGWEAPDDFESTHCFRLSPPGSQETLWLEVAPVEGFVTQEDEDNLLGDAGLTHPRPRHGTRFLGRFFREAGSLTAQKETFSATEFDADGNDRSLDDEYSTHFPMTLGVDVTMLMGLITNLDNEDALLALVDDAPADDETSSARALTWRMPAGDVRAHWSQQRSPKRWSLHISAQVRIPLHVGATFVGYRQYHPEQIHHFDLREGTWRVEHNLSYTNEWESYEEDGQTLPTPALLGDFERGAPSEVEVPLPFDTTQRLILRLERVEGVDAPDPYERNVYGEQLCGLGDGVHYLGTFLFDEDGDGEWLIEFERDALLDPTADFYEGHRFPPPGDDREGHHCVLKDVNDAGSSRAVFNASPLAPFASQGLLGRWPQWTTRVLGFCVTSGRRSRLAWREEPRGLWSLEVIESGQRTLDGEAQQYMTVTTYHLDWANKTMAFSQRFCQTPC